LVTLYWREREGEKKRGRERGRGREIDARLLGLKASCFFLYHHGNLPFSCPQNPFWSLFMPNIAMHSLQSTLDCLLYCNVRVVFVYWNKEDRQACGRYLYLLVSIVSKQ
jgi:hypothetical protein